jgi:DHA1 family bicyclomycin/chloramphenicol resistance-like MFS transporter
VWRVVQAIGACAGVALGRAMVRDLFTGERAAQMLSNLMMIMAIAPMMGPLAGAQILRLSSWRAIFWTLVIIALATLFGLARIPETLAPERRVKEPLSGVFVTYLSLLRSPILLAYAGAGAFAYGAVFSYVAASPFAYISYYHVPPQLYGLLFASGIVGIMISNFANARLVIRFGSLKLLRVGANGALAAALLLALSAKTGFAGLAGLAIPIFLFLSMVGLIITNSIAGALSHYPKHAGSVSALVGASQYGFGILGSALVSSFNDGTPWPMAAVIALSTGASVLCAWSLPSGRA